MMHVTRTTVDVDEQALEMARAELGTTGLSATVNGALRDVARRRGLAQFDVLRDIDGTPAEVEANRRERSPEQAA
jgi:Arc/MetJ family transcription regulator